MNNFKDINLYLNTNEEFIFSLYRRAYAINDVNKIKIVGEVHRNSLAGFSHKGNQLIETDNYNMYDFTHKSKRYSAIIDKNNKFIKNEIYLKIRGIETVLNLKNIDKPQLLFGKSLKIINRSFQILYYDDKLMIRITNDNGDIDDVNDNIYEIIMGGIKYNNIFDKFKLTPGDELLLKSEINLLP